MRRISIGIGIVALVAVMSGCSAFLPDSPDGSSQADRALASFHAMNADQRAAFEDKYGPLDADGDGTVTTGEAIAASTRAVAQGAATGDTSVFSLSNLMMIVGSVLGLGATAWGAKKGAKALSGAIVSAGTGDGDSA